MLNVLESDTKDFQKVVNNILIEVKPMRLRGKISDDFLGYVNELRKQITNLEIKLAESNKLRIATKWEVVNLEKQSNEWRELAISYRKENDQLKQQPAKSKEQCRECKHLNKKIELNIKNKLMTEIAQLKQQLAEEKNRNKKLNHEAQKYYEDAYCNGFQNQTAIDELEKVKEYNKSLVYGSSLIDKFIDKQIKSLKGDDNEN